MRSTTPPSNVDLEVGPKILTDAEAGTFRDGVNALEMSRAKLIQSRVPEVFGRGTEHVRGLCEGLLAMLDRAAGNTDGSREEARADASIRCSTGCHDKVFGGLQSWEL